MWIFNRKTRQQEIGAMQCQTCGHIVHIYNTDEDMHVMQAHAIITHGGTVKGRENDG